MQGSNMHNPSVGRCMQQGLLHSLTLSPTLITKKSLSPLAPEDANGNLVIQQTKVKLTGSDGCAGIRGKHYRYW